MFVCVLGSVATVDSAAVATESPAHPSIVVAHVVSATILPGTHLPGLSERQRVEYVDPPASRQRQLGEVDGRDGLIDHLPASGLRTVW